MCPNTCLAYTGPSSDLESCPKCGELRWDTVKLTESNGKKKQAACEFHTIPLGPQLQALWRSSESTNHIRHCFRRTQKILAILQNNLGKLDEYDDIYCGADYLRAVQDGNIAKHDMLLLHSIDGAQLYESR